MRFGLFGSAQAGKREAGLGTARGFHDCIDFNVEAESLGYVGTFLVEHHFSGWSQVSAMVGGFYSLISRSARVDDLSDGMCDSTDVDTALAEAVAYFVHGFEAPPPKRA